MGSKAEVRPFYSEGRPDTPSYGETIRQHRLSLGFSQQELKRITNISQTTISILEREDFKRGKDGLGFKLVLSLARVFGTGIRFLDGVEEKKVFPVYPLNELRFLIEDPNTQEAQRNVISALETQISSSGLIVEHPDLIYLDLDPLFLTDQKYLNRRIQNRRLATGMSQDKLAFKSGMLQGSLSLIESGYTKNPLIQTVRKIAGGLNITIEDLLGLERVELPKGLEVIDQFLRSREIRAELKGPLIKILEHFLRIIKTGTIPRLSIEISGTPPEVEFLSGLTQAYSRLIQSGASSKAFSRS